MSGTRSRMNDKIASKIILWTFGMACAGLLLTFKDPLGTTKEHLFLIGGFATVGFLLGTLFSFRLRNSK
jgi:hypothetical protein